MIWALWREVCDKVAVIYAGDIVEYGTKEQIFDASHPSVYRRSVRRHPQHER